MLRRITRVILELTSLINLVQGTEYMGKVGCCQNEWLCTSAGTYTLNNPGAKLNSLLIGEPIHSLHTTLVPQLV